MKTISNMFNSTKKEIVIDASNDNYDVLGKLDLPLTAKKPLFQE